MDRRRVRTAGGERHALALPPRKLKAGMRVIYSLPPGMPWPMSQHNGKAGTVTRATKHDIEVMLDDGTSCGGSPQFFTPEVK
jgi:hypothetical protein